MKIANPENIFTDMPEPENFMEGTLAFLLADSRKKFKYGRTVSTSLAVETFKPGFLTKCLCRHITGDWGALDEEDMEANDNALEHGGRLLSNYVHPETRERLWIITEHDRSVTTMMLPMEY